jgi:hypothetical protein
MDSNLDTTNILLGIMAATSLLQALVLIGVSIAGWKMYRRWMAVTTDLESRLITPTMIRVQRVLDDVHAVTSTVKGETERVDDAIHRTMDRVDDTARRMRSNVMAKTSRLVGFVRGARAAIESLLEDHNRNQAMNART